MPISEFTCPRRRLRTSANLLAVWLLSAALTLTGCETLQEAGFSPQAPQASGRFDAVKDYLAYMHSLVTASPQRKRRSYQQAAAAYQKNPTPHNQLRLALALSTLGEPYEDLTKARRLLKELSATPERLPADVKWLVTLQFSAVDQRLALAERNAILRKQLEDAEEKIDALTTIEQTLEQPASEEEQPVP